MSDIYIELRNRIPVVSSWTHIGTERLQQLQDQTGLSNERLARRLHVSEKTWRRHKKRGEVPTNMLPALSQVLPLDLRPASRQAVEVTELGAEEPLHVTLRTILQNQERHAETLDRLLCRLEILEKRLERERAPRRRGG